MNANLKWAIGFAAAAAVCAGGAALMYNMGSDGAVAEIYVQDELVRTVPLDRNEETYEFDVETENGINRIRVENGKIGVIYSDCPDQVCVNRGMADNGALPIVCLPHRVSVVIKNAEDAGVDAVVGGY